MKKFILIVFLFALSQMSFAQNIAPDSVIVKNKIQKNEIALNIGDFIVSNRIGFIYERFLHKKHSVLINIVGFDKILNGEPSPFLYQKAVSYGLAYRFYRVKNNTNSGFFISPMARIRQNYNSVSYKIINENTFELSRGSSNIVSTGLGLGAKFTEKKITFTLQTNLFYNFIPKKSNESDIYYLEEISEPQPISFGVLAGFGYRF